MPKGIYVVRFHLAPNPETLTFFQAQSICFQRDENVALTMPHIADSNFGY